MNTWLKIITNKGWRVFPSSISKQYMQNVSTGRTQPVVADRVTIDTPGMIMADRTYQNIDLDGLDLEIPSSDFPLLYSQLSKAKEEILPGGSSVFKLRGYIAGLVLTLELRNMLLQKMSDMLPAVKIIAQKEDEEFSRRIDAVNKISPVKVLSARAEMTKQKSDEDKEKPN